MGIHPTGQRSFLDASPRGAPHCGPTFPLIQRGAGGADVSSAVFAAKTGELLGPLSTESGRALIRVLSRLPAQLNQRTRSAVEHLLFDEWLAERRRTARIEWYWGPAARSLQRD